MQVWYLNLYSSLIPRQLFAMSGPLTQGTTDIRCKMSLLASRIFHTFPCPWLPPFLAAIVEIRSCRRRWQPWSSNVGNARDRNGSKNWSCGTKSISMFVLLSSCLSNQIIVIHKKAASNANIAFDRFFPQSPPPVYRGFEDSVDVSI